MFLPVRMVHAIRI